MHFLHKGWEGVTTFNDPRSAIHKSSSNLTMPGQCSCCHWLPAPSSTLSDPSHGWSDSIQWPFCFFSEVILAFSKFHCSSWGKRLTEQSHLVSLVCCSTTDAYTDMGHTCLCFHSLWRSPKLFLWSCHRVCGAEGAYCIMSLFLGHHFLCVIPGQWMPIREQSYLF